ncbi:MAG: hypothetical protein WA672_14970, partial [Candidatus Angelobacter sp.]
FASGALSAGGGMAFNTLLGYIGIEQPDAKIRTQLQDISDRLAGLAKSIAEVNQRMINLSKQLAIATQEIQEATQEGILARALVVINTHSSGFAMAPSARKKQGSNADCKIGSLAEILNARINNDRLSRKMLKTFFDDVIGTWDIPSRVNEISSGLLGSKMEGGLLSIFTRLSVERMGEAQWDPRLFNFYLNLESCFLSYLGAQMRGVFLAVAAKTYGTPPESVSPRAAEYLWEQYVPNVLYPQLDRFLRCAERLALSQGQWRSPWPTTGSSSYTDQQGRVRLAGGLGAPPELTKILLRSELLARRITEIFRDMRNYKSKFPERFPLAELTPLARTKGIYVHRLCRESEVNEGKGPELKPWPGYESRGRVLPGTGSMIPQWGIAQGGFAKLKPEQSGIQVVRYFWPEVESPAGKPTSFPDALPAGKSYSETDLATALELRWAGFGNATHYRDMKDLCMVPQFVKPSAAAWTVSPAIFEKGHNSGTFTSQYLDQPLMSPVYNRPDNRAHFTFEVTKISGRGNAMSANCRMESPLFSYEGIQPRGVTLHLWMEVNNYRKAYRDKLVVNMNGRLIVMLKKPNGEQKIYDSEAVPNFSLWDWNGAGSDARRQDEPRLSVALKVGETGNPEQYSLLVHLQVAHQGLGRDIKASIRGLIKECALSWTAAIPPMLAKTKKVRSKGSETSVLS